MDLISLTVDAAGDIDTNKYEEMNSEVTEKLLDMEEKMEQDRKIFEEQTERLMEQLKKGEREKADPRKRDQAQHEKELREMHRRLKEMSGMSKIFYIVDHRSRLFSSITPKKV